MLDSAITPVITLRSSVMIGALDMSLRLWQYDKSDLRVVCLLRVHRDARVGTRFGFLGCLRFFRSLFLGLDAIGQH